MVIPFKLGSCVDSLDLIIIPIILETLLFPLWKFVEIFSMYTLHKKKPWNSQLRRLNSNLILHKIISIVCNHISVNHVQLKNNVHKSYLLWAETKLSSKDLRSSNVLQTMFIIRPFSFYLFTIHWFHSFAEKSSK